MRTSITIRTKKLMEDKNRMKTNARILSTPDTVCKSSLQVSDNIHSSNNDTTNNKIDE